MTEQSENSLPEEFSAGTQGVTSDIPGAPEVGEIEVPPAAPAGVRTIQQRTVRVGDKKVAMPDKDQPKNRDVGFTTADPVLAENEKQKAIQEAHRNAGLLTEDSSVATSTGPALVPPEDPVDVASVVDPNLPVNESGEPVAAEVPVPSQLTPPEATLPVAGDEQPTAAPAEVPAEALQDPASKEAG